LLEEIEVPQSIDLGVVDTMFARSLGMTETAATFEIDLDRQLPLPGIEVHPVHEPRRSNAQSSRKQIVGRVGHLASTSAHPSTQGS
jgi:hypothetical protein